MSARFSLLASSHWVEVSSQRAAPSIRSWVFGDLRRQGSFAIPLSRGVAHTWRRCMSYLPMPGHLVARPRKDYMVAEPRWVAVDVPVA